VGSKKMDFYMNILKHSLFILLFSFMVASNVQASAEFVQKAADVAKDAQQMAQNAIKQYGPEAAKAKEYAVGAWGKFNRACANLNGAAKQAKDPFMQVAYGTVTMERATLTDGTNVSVDRNLDLRNIAIEQCRTAAGTMLLHQTDVEVLQQLSKDPAYAAQVNAILQAHDKQVAVAAYPFKFGVGIIIGGVVAYKYREEIKKFAKKLAKIAVCCGVVYLGWTNRDKIKNAFTPAAPAA
jgi:hypothetical protein